ncbi:MAG: Ig-like domain-containing protein [Eubacteriales bacterium]|nr:Ig-like domain-containing protein [Eubacteriales bacterium]MDD3882872.1 Ig-like domain-containing protein [Eubacteriales bacterium]MDD4512092.1 Ig-like domain-containing protein [Eubacteriales bacterium]
MKRFIPVLLALVLVLLLPVCAFAAEEETDYVRVMRLRLYEDGIDGALMPVSSDSVNLAVRPCSLLDAELPALERLEDVGSDALGEVKLIPLGSVTATAEDGRLYIKGIQLDAGTYACQLVFSPSLRSNIMIASTSPSGIPANAEIVPATAISIDKKLEMYAGDKLMLPLTYEPTDANSFNIKASYGAKNVLDFSSGILTALKKGESYLYLSPEGGRRSTLYVNVRQRAESVSVNKTAFTIAEGKSERITASVLPANANNKKLVYTSSNEEVATVNANGTVKAVSLGECVITVASADNPAASAECDVSVTVLVSKVKMQEPEVMYVGETQQLVFSVEPDNASAKSLTFKSGNTKAATVDENGVITAVGRGKATITATSTDGGRRSTYVTVTVKQQPTGISLAKTELSLNTGIKSTLSAKVLPSTANETDLVWSSSDTSIATVTERGTVAGVYPGTCVVTVRSKAFPEIFAECNVTVSQPVTKINFELSSLSLNVGEKERLSWAVQPAYATNQAVTFTSADTSVATVEADGTVHAIKRGKTTITVKATDGSRVTSRITVNVIQPLFGISMRNTQKTVGVNKAAYVYVDLNPSNASNSHITWSSADTSIAKVSGSSVKGRVVGVAWGDTTLTAVSEEGGYTDVMTIHVGDYNEAVSIYELDMYFDDAGVKIPYIRFRNESNFEITRVNFYIYGQDEYGNEVPLWRDYTQGEGRYSRALMPGNRSDSRYFRYDKDYDFEHCEYLRVCIVSYEMADGTLYRISPNHYPTKEWESDIYLSEIENPQPQITLEPPTDPSIG